MSVEAGQVWQDLDSREIGRQLVVDRVDEEYAYCHRRKHYGVKTRIRLDRLQKRFKLVGK
jgi:hypothetical protein